jgi:hypothetical protein
MASPLLGVETHGDLSHQPYKYQRCFCKLMKLDLILCMATAAYAAPNAVNPQLDAAPNAVNPQLDGTGRRFRRWIRDAAHAVGDFAHEELGFPRLDGRPVMG